MSETARIRYLQRALLLRSASKKLAQSRLKTFNHLRFFFVSGSYSFFDISESCVHSDFSTPLKPGSSALPLRQAKAQNDVTFSHSALCSLTDVHAPRGYSSFRHPIHAIHVSFPLLFIYLTTQVHPVFFTSTNLHGLSMVNM